MVDMYDDEQLIEMFNELAAIMEFCGNIPRKQAERLAYFDLRKNVGRDVVIPEEIRAKVRLTERKNDGT